MLRFMLRTRCTLMSSYPTICITLHIEYCRDLYIVFGPFASDKHKTYERIDLIDGFE